MGARTYRIRRPLTHIDSSTVLVLLIFVLMLLPSQLVAPGLSYFGRPATLVSLLLAIWWCASRLHPRLTMTGPQPIRWAVLAYVVAMIASYAAGYLRGLPPLEATGADAAVIGTVAFIGVILMGADGVTNRERMDTILRVFVWCAGAMGMIGLLQAILNFDITQYLVLPGMTLHNDLAGFRARGEGFFQIASTATHYIEFSAVMAVALPFTIHVARFSQRPLTRQLATGCALVCAVAVPISLSRTGILALVLGLTVMWWIWSWRTRYNMLAVMACAVAVFVVIRPGLLGTIRSLFTYFGSDPSIQGRLDDYPVVSRYFSERPWLGRGSGTFVPELYQILDNQWLGTLVAQGLVGVAALAGLHITGVTLAVIAYRRAAREEDRHLCVALVSTQVIAVACGFTFDTLGFETFATLVALLTGFCGAMWRLTHPARQIRTAAAAAPYARSA